MHFKTLVTVNMPTVEEDPHENAAVVQSIELLQARKDDLAKDIMAELTLCSLMGRTTNFARQLVGAVEEVMTPYSTEPPEEYKEFADMTEELKADYAKSVDCLKLPNGKIVECGSYPYFSKYSIVDGKVSQNKVGHLHHTRRTKQSRKIQYLAKIGLLTVIPDIRPVFIRIRWRPEQGLMRRSETRSTPAVFRTGSIHRNTGQKHQKIPMKGG